jgi:hypothetical protein
MKHTIIPELGENMGSVPRRIDRLHARQKRVKEGRLRCGEPGKKESTKV